MGRMSDSFRRTVSAALFLTLLQLCSCAARYPAPAPEIKTGLTQKQEEVPTEAATDARSADVETTAEETEAPKDNTVDLAAAPFRIVSAAGESSARLSSVISAFVTRLGSVEGLKYTVVSDAGGDPRDGAAEIVIGNADRPGCAELYSSLGPLDWVAAVRSGRIYLIGGTPDATAGAVYRLLSDYIAKNKTAIPAGELFRFTSDERMPEIPEAPAYSGTALPGLTVYALGDSYFAGEGLDPKKDVWPALIASEQGQTFENYGAGGSTVSDYITTNNPMCRRISAMKNGSPDIVLFEGGANDWNHCVPVGEPGSVDTKTFRGAVASCIGQLHEKYPDAFIVCITNWDYGKKNAAGAESTAYADAFCETASGFPYAMAINASDTSLVPAFVSNAVFRAKYCISAQDSSHLNKEGMKLVAPFFIKLIDDGYEEFLKSR